MKRVVANQSTQSAKEFISKNLKISDKGLENAIRHILFDANNVVDWDKAVGAFKEYMPELVATSMVLDFEKCKSVASTVLEGKLNNKQADRAEDVDLDLYGDAEDLASDLSALLYIMYGVEDGEDYQIMNGMSLMMVNPRKPIWTGIRADLSE